MVKDEQVKYLIQNYPKLSEDNTEFCIKFWQLACKQRGLEISNAFWDVIRTYKPEAITRKRREFTDSSQKQREKEEEYHNNYSI